MTGFKRPSEFKTWYVILAIIVLSGTLLRVYFIDYRAFWVCELYSVSYGNASLKELLSILQSDNQMPLYYLLLHYWISFLGDSDIAVRSFSVFWGVIGFGGIFYLLRDGLRWSLKSVLIAEALLAVNPFHVYYSIEGRHYSMYFAIAMFYLAALIRMHSEPKGKTLMIFAGFQGLLLYLHPTALLYCAAIDITYLFLLFSFHDATRARVKAFAIGNLITALLFLPWAVTYLHQVKYTYETFIWAPSTSIIAAVRAWGSITLFSAAELVEWLSSGARLQAFKPVIWACLVVPAGILMVKGFVYVIKKKYLAESLVILSLFTYPGVIYVVSVLVKPLLVKRILIPSVIGSLVLLLISEEKSPPSGRRTVSTLLGIFFLTSVCLTYAMIATGKSADLRKIVPIISQRAEEKDLVLFYASDGALLFKRYSKLPLVLKGVTGDFEEEIEQRSSLGFDYRHQYVKVDSPEVVERLNQLVDGRRRFFLVLFPVSQQRIIQTDKFLLHLWRDYRIDETILIDQMKVYVLSRPPHMQTDD